jgi:hypothetical protein
MPKTGRNVQAEAQIDETQRSTSICPSASSITSISKRVEAEAQTLKELPAIEFLLHSRLNNLVDAA